MGILKLFVAGIDTDVGKTIATGALAAEFIAKGKKTITQKIVQTGCEGIAEDIIKHREIMCVPLNDDDVNRTTCPYVFRTPCSPHLAAKQESETIDFSVIDESTKKLEKNFEIILIEGAGGLLVPINNTELQIDFVAQRELPVVLVTSAKLGSINHTLLSVEALKKRNIEIIAVVYNQYPTIEEPIYSDTLNVLKKELKKDDVPILLLNEKFQIINFEIFYSKIMLD
jgi:dethiobiotin synthetase